jgi:hypothetical protein
LWRRASNDELVTSETLIRHQQTRTPRFAGCLVFRFTMCAESALKDPAREILSYVAQP